MSAITKLVWVCGVWGVLISGSGRGLGQESPAPGADSEAAAVTTLSAGANQPPPPDPADKTPSAAKTPSADKMPSAAKTPSAGQSQPRKSAADSSSPATRKTTLRLPTYFGMLVDSQQRAAIYEIREAMSEKITALELQLEKLREAEMQEIEAVLSDAQRQKLELLRASRSAASAAREP